MSQLHTSLRLGTPTVAAPAQQSSSALMATPQDGAMLSQAHHERTPELELVRQEMDVLRGRERQVMELIGCHRPELLVHDLRNILNEVQLLKLLARLDEPEV
jgi:hypothetical protein